GASTPSERFSWTSRDAMLYALGVGADSTELEFVTQNSYRVPQRVLPTYAVIVADASAALPLAGTFDASQVVHGSQSMRLHRPLPPDGSVDTVAHVADIIDKGQGGNE